MEYPEFQTGISGRMESARDRSFRGANLDPSPSMACHVGYNQNEGLLPVTVASPMANITLRFKTRYKPI